jgi:hypothetical protein
MGVVCSMGTKRKQESVQQRQREWDFLGRIHNLPTTSPSTSMSPHYLNFGQIALHRPTYRFLTLKNVGEVKLCVCVSDSSPLHTFVSFGGVEGEMIHNTNTFELPLIKALFSPTKPFDLMCDY